MEKQERELKKIPEILIATAGRLWDLIEGAQHPSLKTLCKSQFLIFDEIDRILELGQYKELEKVLKYIENPTVLETHETFNNVAVVNSIDEIPNFEAPELTEDEFFAQIEEIEKKKLDSRMDTNKNRRTFVVSATLGKSFYSSRLMNKTTKKKMKKLLKDNPEVTPNMKIKEIMHKIKFKNKTKIIDETQEAILPANLELLKLETSKEEKNLYLYHFLKINPKTPTIIFCNSINSVKRTQAFLKASGVQSVCLHAQLQ